jgi:CubicO group peptidase (beta-lactamase class C family)
MKAKKRWPRWRLGCWCIMAAALWLPTLAGCTGLSSSISEKSDATPLLTEADDPRLNPLREWVKGFTDREETPGIGLLVAHKGRIVFWEAYGAADPDFDKPFHKDTIVFLASTSKPISTTAIMILVDEGRLSLDDPISKYLPEFSRLHYQNGDPAPAPTLRQLLSHTSGWPGLNEMSPEADLTIRDMNLTLSESVDRISRVKLLAEPGTRFAYGGISYNVAGRIVEIVSGQPFDVFIQERLFDPLGMKDTGFRPSPVQGERVAGIFKPAPWGGQINLMRFNPDAQPKLLLIAGGLYSTVGDLAVFTQMHLNGGRYGSVRILSPEAVIEMQRHQIGTANLADVPLREVTSYGLGWIRERTKDSGSAISISHAGAFGSIIWIDHERELIGVLTTPMPLANAHAIHQQIRGRVADLFPVNH